MNTARQLFDEISRDYKPNTKKPELGEFCELRLFGKQGLVHFTIGWYDEFDVQFNPKTVKARYTKIDRVTKDKKTVIKQFPLEQKDLLDKILELYVK